MKEVEAAKKIIEQEGFCIGVNCDFCPVRIACANSCGNYWPNIDELEEFVKEHEGE